MNPVKLIVTNKSNLEFKYGKKFSDIPALLKKMQVADKKKGLDTKIAYVDDAASLKSLGVKKIKVSTEAEYKRVVDDLYKKHIPAYIVILGAQDIFPFQKIVNPVQDGEDPDKWVESDLPYACDTPYSKRIDNFTGPTRVVGRIPDIMGAQTDTQYLETIITNSIRHEPTNADEYRKYFAVSALVWQKSTAQSVQNMFGENKKLITSPNGKTPKTYKPFTKKQLAPLTHFYNCHGDNLVSSFFGQEGEEFPEALRSVNLPHNISPGTIVAAECCFGAQLFDAAQIGLPHPGIATTYLANDAIAFLGSSNIAYGPPDSQDLADLITQDFIIHILTGASTGRAFLEARQDYLLKVGPDLNPYELKTLAQFYLLGDPSVQPATCDDVETKTFSVGTAIANSRENLSRKGFSLAGSNNVCQKQRKDSPVKSGLPMPDNQTMSVTEILEKNNFKQGDKKSVYLVKPKAADRNSIQKKMLGKNVKFHTYIQSSKKKVSNISNIRVLVVKENTSQILGWRVYESK